MDCFAACILSLLLAFVAGVTIHLHFGCCGDPEEEAEKRIAILNAAFIEEGGRVRRV